MSRQRSRLGVVYAGGLSEESTAFAGVALLRLRTQVLDLTLPHLTLTNTVVHARLQA